MDFSLDREHLVVFNSVVWWFELLPRACLYTLTELKQGHERSSLPELRANSVVYSLYRANLPRALTLPAREMGKQSAPWKCSTSLPFGERETWERAGLLGEIQRRWTIARPKEMEHRRQSQEVPRSHRTVYAPESLKCKTGQQYLLRSTWLVH